MASAIVRSSLRSALRGGARANPASKRFFSSGASADEEAREAAKWEKITYAGIAACTVLAFVNLSKGHPHFDEPPPYPYLHIRNKEFPWALVVELVQVQMASLKSRNTIEARRSDLTAGTAIMSFS